MNWPSSSRACSVALHRAFGHRTQICSIPRELHADPHSRYHAACWRNPTPFAAVVELRGDIDRAEQLYQRALAMREALLGDVHPDVALTSNNLGQLLTGRGDRYGTYLRRWRLVRFISTLSITADVESIHYISKAMHIRIPALRQCARSATTASVKICKTNRPSRDDNPESGALHDNENRSGTCPLLQ